MRGIFELHCQKYSLPITDPQTRDVLKYFDDGLYSPDDLDNRHFQRENIFLTLSLSEPFTDGFCYKLISGIISI